MTEYRMTSHPMVHTPGLVRAARATARTDLDYWNRVFTEGYCLPHDAAVALIKGEVDYTVDAANTVVFTYTPEVKPDDGSKDGPVPREVEIERDMDPHA